MLHMSYNIATIPSVDLVISRSPKTGNSKVLTMLYVMVAYNLATRLSYSTTLQIALNYSTNE